MRIGGPIMVEADEASICDDGDSSAVTAIGSGALSTTLTLGPEPASSFPPASSPWMLRRCELIRPRCGLGTFHLSFWPRIVTTTITTFAAFHGLVVRQQLGFEGQ